MAEPRDRLIRLDHQLSPISAQRSIRDAEFWRNFGSQREESQLSPLRFSSNGFRSHIPWRVAGTSPGSVVSRVHYGSSPNGREQDSRRRYSFGGQENFRAAGRGGGSPSTGPQRHRRRARTGVLPSWYPRRPLQDITAVVNAIERRSRMVGEVYQNRLASPSFQELARFDPSLSIAGAPLEHSIPYSSPKPMVVPKTYSSPVGRLSEILLRNQTPTGQADFLTPQKKLLNSIDQVEKVVMEDLRRMKRTPTAKKVEREKKVRTLMAMR